LMSHSSSPSSTLDLAQRRFTVADVARVGHRADAGRHRTASMAFPRPYMQRPLKEKPLSDSIATLWDLDSFSPNTFSNYHACYLPVLLPSCGLLLYLCPHPPYHYPMSVDQTQDSIDSSGSWPATGRQREEHLHRLTCWVYSTFSDDNGPITVPPRSVINHATII